MKSRAMATFVWSIVALQVVLIALNVVFEALARSATSSLGPGFAVEVGGNAITTLAFPAVGALIFWRRPEHPIGWLFCAANLGWAINNSAASYARYALVTNPGSLPAGELMAWFSTWPGPMSMGLYILLVLLFPDGRLPSARWRTFAWLVVGWSAVAAVTSAFAPGPVNETVGLEVGNPLGVDGSLGRLLAQFNELLLPLSLVLFAVTATSMVLRWRHARGIERQQLKWFTSSVALGSLLFVVMVALYSRYGSSPDAMPGWAQVFIVATILSFGLIPVAAGIAILRYRLYDIDRIINRTLVYGLLTAMLALIYLGGVVGMQALLRALTGQGSQLAVVASTLAIAALFGPLRRRMQAFIDRRFYRKKYDAAKTLAAFGARLRDETDLHELSGDLVRIVQETMQPAHVSLWLRSPPGVSRIATEEQDR
jgi:cytochrome b subunit of formate dehydrogenase